MKILIKRTGLFVFNHKYKIMIEGNKNDYKIYEFKAIDKVSIRDLTVLRDFINKFIEEKENTDCSHKGVFVKTEIDGFYKIKCKKCGEIYG